MLLDIYLISICFAILLMFYAWTVRDTENYTHILAGFTSGILYLILGFEMFGGVSCDYVLLNNTTATEGAAVLQSASYTSSPISLFLVIYGAIMILYAVVAAIDIIRSASEKL